jgi:hypothetical protein
VEWVLWDVVVSVGMERPSLLVPSYCHLLVR